MAEPAGTSSRLDGESGFRVVVVDDHPLYRTSLSLMVRDVEATAIVEEAGTLAEAVALCRAGPAARLILTDITMPDASGLMAISALRDVAGGAPVIVVSGTEDGGFIRRCIDAGAAGYVTKSQPAADMRAALKDVIDGHTYVPPGAAASPAATDAPVELTARQTEVLECIERGLSNKRIAITLGIGIETVKKHVQVVMGSLGVHTRAEVMVAAPRLRERGLLPPRRQYPW